MIEFNTISELFIKASENYSNKIAFRYKEKGDWKSISHKELFSLSLKIAFSLNELGLIKGDRVLLLSENRIEWIIFDIAFSHLGIVSVPVFSTTSSKQLDYIINHSECKAVVVSNKYQLKKIEEIREDIPSVKLFISIDECETTISEIKRYKQLLHNVETTEHILAEFINQKASSIKTEDLLTIIYTSGTTGNPKGVMLSNKNIIANLRAILDTGYFNNMQRSLSYLPLCHAYERTAGYYLIYSTGCIITLCENLDSISSYLLESKPQLMTTVPELMEKIRMRIHNSMNRESERKQKIFNWAIKVGKDYVNTKTNNNRSLLRSLKFKIADILVYSKIKDKMGGSLEYLVSGGAAMNYETAIFFEMLNVKTLQGYGLTEASPVISFNLPHSNELDTVGKPLNNIEVKIADDGEILCRGESIMMGYFNDKEGTEKTIDSEKWLYTGDIGKFTELGNLKITDRKKNIFVNSSGKNVAPQIIENEALKSRFIEQICLIGNDRPFCTALIYPNVDQILYIAKKLEVKGDFIELIHNPKIQNFVKNDIDYNLTSLSKFEQIRKFTLLEKPFSLENGELSHKMAIKRHIIDEKYQDIIESMYL